MNWAFSSTHIHYRERGRFSLSHVDLDIRLVFRRLAQISLLAVVYYLLARLGLYFAIPPGNSSAVWPPSGLALAALLLFSRWVVPGVFLGAFWAYLHTGVAWETACITASGNALASLIAATLCLKFLDLQNLFATLRDCWKWLGITVVSCCVAASVGVGTLWVTGYIPNDLLLENWMTWWLGDVTGMMIFAPFLLSLCIPRAYQITRKNRAELGVAFLMMLTVSLLLFMDWMPENTAEGLLYLPILILFWIRVRFNLAYVLSGNLLLAIIAVWGTSHNWGAFSTEAQSKSLLDLQLFLNLCALNTLLVSALLTLRFQSLQDGSQLKARVEVSESKMILAHNVQRKLFPVSDFQGDGYQCAGICRAAEQTSGDYYDYFLQDDGQVVLLIADVSGHGIGSAILMAETRAYARALMLTPCSLENFAGRMNSFLLNDTDTGIFVTMMVCRYQPLDQQMEFLGAGHDGLVIRGDGSLHKMTSSTFPLGLVDELRKPQSQQLQLSPGDSVYLYTDGFFESQSKSGELFGRRRLRKEFSRLRTAPPHFQLINLAESVSRFMANSTPSDDQTAVILQVTGASETR